MNKSGWWMWIGIIPLLGPVILLVLFCRASNTALESLRPDARPCRRARHPVGVRCPAPAKNTLDPDMDADDYSTSRNCDGAIAGGESESSSATLTVW